MNRYNLTEIGKKEWPSVIDYHHQPASDGILGPNPGVLAWRNKYVTQPSLQPWQSTTANQDTGKQQLYNPFIEEDMDISDDEKRSKNKTVSALPNKTTSHFLTANSGFSVPQPSRRMEIKSGAAFYQGLILYIPSFEQIVNTDKNSSAIKMLFASFEFSFKVPMKIEIKQREIERTVTDATVIFQDQIIIKGATWTPAAHNEISVKALELLSETCYTIQAKENYFLKCKLIDASEMKTLNLMKWDMLLKKYPKLKEITKDSHIQKTLSVFLDIHTSTGFYEDVICCNLSRDDVRNIKGVVDFFKLTMLPCCVTTNLSKNQGPCVVSIHKYTSAKKLLEILVESGGENDKFILHPPDTFKDFYKLHQNVWDPKLQIYNQNKILKLKTTLEDEEIQSGILKPYENIIAELFEKQTKLPKDKKQVEDSKVRRDGDNFMKETLKIDVAQSKSVAPVDRMQLLLKYMEQLQEYGSRVLTSGRPEMIKIYHNAIENLRKDLEACRKDIEKEQKDKTAVKEEKKSENHRSRTSKSPSSRKRTPLTTSRKSPIRKSQSSRKRSVSPKRRPRSRSPRKSEKRRSASPKRNPRSVSPRRRPRSRSPRSRSGRTTRNSPPRRTRSPHRKTSPLRSTWSPKSRSPQTSKSQESEVLITIFKHQFKNFVEMLRRNRIDIEDTPIERRGALEEKFFKYKEQYQKFRMEAFDNKRELGCFLDEIDICGDELAEQEELIAGKPGPNDLPKNITPPWTNIHSFQDNTVPQYVSYPYPATPAPPVINKPPVMQPPQYRLPFLFN